ncbi:hypothetical protein GVN18_35770 [Pseudomonas sp. ODNR1LW]|nr:hypothetical protein [Pseudomonas sp. ODNR1LW]
MIEALLFIALGISGALVIASALGAHFAADYFKRNKMVAKSTRDFVSSAPAPFFLQMGISLRDIFSDTHKAYGNKFISRCIYTARVSTIAVGVLTIAMVTVIGV